MVNYSTVADYSPTVLATEVREKTDSYCDAADSSKLDEASE